MSVPGKAEWALAGGGVVWQFSLRMAGGDVRGVLQYVPQFRGRVFAVLFDEGLLPEPAVAETLLDLKALQEIGVQLVIGVLGGELDALATWCTELEIKHAPVDATVGDGHLASACAGVLARGQAVLLDGRGRSAFDADLSTLIHSLNAAKLIALVNGAGVVYRGGPLHAVSVSEATNLATDEEVEGRELLEGAARSCEAGIPRVHVLDGRQQGVLADELFSNEGVGTMVHTDSYREIRPLREEDIPELLAMVGRSVRESHLVPRSYEDIEQQSESYLVMGLDDNVVGCVALYEYDGGAVGEIGCLYVKQSHEGVGYGQMLVVAAEALAEERGMERVFALSNRAANFFTKHLGYHEVPVAAIPAERREKLAESGRASIVLAKSFGSGD